MAGDNQHFLPRFLQKGFTSTFLSRKEVYVWYFPKDGSPREENTKKVGEEFQFYGASGVGSLDDLITQKEDMYGKCLDRVRENGEVLASDKDTLIQFVHSLSLRTKHLRDSILRGSDAVMNELSVFTQAEKIPGLMLQQMRKNSPLWKQASADYVRSRRSARNRHEIRAARKREKRSFKQWFKHGAKAHAEKEAAKNSRLFAEWNAQKEEIVKERFNKTLPDVFQPNVEDPSPRLQHYRQLQWRVQRLASGSLILGDVGVLVMEQDSTLTSAAFKAKGDLLLLPISDDLLVIGSAGNVIKLPYAPVINRYSAELSLYFFIASRNSEQEVEYHRFLGRKPVPIPSILNAS